MVSKFSKSFSVQLNYSHTLLIPEITQKSKKWSGAWKKIHLKISHFNTWLDGLIG